MMIKKITLALMLMIVVTACGQNNKKAESTAKTTTSDIVNVYYFHGKTRCATCIAVGDVAKKTVETAFAGNKKVVFSEINVSDKANEALAEKYQVTWNALIIAKGDSSVDITQQAFSTALENPQMLEAVIKDEVNKRL